MLGHYTLTYIKTVTTRPSNNTNNRKKKWITLQWITIYLGTVNNLEN